MNSSGQNVGTFIDVRFCGFDDCDWDGEVLVERDMENATEWWDCPRCKAEHSEYFDEGWYE